MRRRAALGAAIGAVCALAGCDAVFGLYRPQGADAAIDGTAIDGDAPIDAPGDAPIDGMVDAMIDAPPMPICPGTYGVVGTLPGSYRYVVTGTGWQAAEAACAADQVSNSTLHTHLVVVSTETERSMLQAAHNGSHIWIGLSDRLTEGFYRWVTSENTNNYPPATGGPWAANQPGLSPTEDCVEMNGTAEFVESDCSLGRSYFCECDASAVAPNF